MPTIRSRKYPDRIHYVTVEDWQVFQDKGLDNRYVVIDDKDIQDTVIETPHSFEINDVQDLGEEMTRDEIKEELDNLGVEYNARVSTDKLYQLYLDNQNL